MKLPGAEKAEVTEARMIQELEDVILTCDLPAKGLARGDIGSVVLVHEGGKGYEVEFTTLDGETIAVVTLNAKQVRQVNRVRSRMCATWRLIL